jgi:hypothetical protein
MDSGLINLMPSLVSRRSAAAQRDEYVDPPPPYIQGQYDHSSSVDVPLSLDLCLSTNTINSPPGRSSMWSHDATMALELDTTYQEFMALLQRKICRVNFSLTRADVRLQSWLWPGAELRGNSASRSWMSLRRIGIGLCRDWRRLVSEG